MEKTRNSSGLLPGSEMGGFEHIYQLEGDNSAPERIRTRVRELEESLRKTAVGIYRHQSTPRDIMIGSMSAMVIEAQIRELEWVLSQLDHA